MSKLLIAGATGTIGTQLVKELNAAGTSFEVMTSKPGTQPNTRVASYADVKSLERAFAGVEHLFVLLPLVPQKVEWARNIAAAAKAAGVRHIVRSSGAGADPASPYSLPKLQGTVDAIVADTGIATTFLRPAGFMQNYATFQAAQVKAGMLYAASADAPQSLVDARDIAAVAATILREPSAHAGRAYTVTGGEALTDTERARILSDAIGRPVGFTAISVAQAREEMAKWGLPPEMLDWMSSLDEIVSAGYAGAISADVSTLLERAPIKFNQFARDYAATWK